MRMTTTMKALVTDNTLSPVKPSYPESLIHRLPVELLQQIFLLIVHNVPDCPSIFYLEYYKDHHFPGVANIITANFDAPPLLFTRVCCLWRTIAHSTTRLWSRIRVDLPRGCRPLKPFLPSLLRLWLVRSGNQPLNLILHIDDRSFMFKGKRAHGYRPKSEANSQLLEILLAERGRWDTVTFASSTRYMEVELDTPLDTPQLRILKCDSSDVRKFYAPNLSRLHVTGFTSLSAVPSGPTLTTTSIRHLHLNDATIETIYSIAMVFPCLENLAADQIYSGYMFDSGCAVTHSSLEIQSLTLPLNSPHLLDVFNELHLPKLQRLILVGKIGETEVGQAMMALTAASCHPLVVEFRSTTPLSEVDAGIAESLKRLLSTENNFTWSSSKTPNHAVGGTQRGEYMFSLVRT